jgi:uncharacterized damage-inducible protein DinB
LLIEHFFSSRIQKQQEVTPMDQTQQIADAYNAVTLKSPWYGPPLAELLAKTSAELATQPPLPGTHSISALLQHLLLWNDRTLHVSDTSPMPAWNAEKEWAEPPIPWNELVPRWNRSRDSLERKIRTFSLADLSKQVPGRDYSYEVLFHGTVQHTIYHSGQIAMVLSLLRPHSH